MKRLLMTLLFLWNTCIAQDANLQTIHEIMDKLMETQETPMDYSQLEDELIYISEHPFNLNKVNGEALKRLIFLSPMEQEAILQHREKYGDYQQLQELQTIEQLSAQHLNWLLYFVTLEELNTTPHTFTELMQKGEHVLFVLNDAELEDRKGYIRKADGTTAYIGSQQRVAIKYRFTALNRLKFGYQGEKDAGELMTYNYAIPNFDFNSFYLIYKPSVRYIETIALGDYQVNFSQGLVFASGFGGGKSSYVLNTCRQYIHLDASKSLNESGYLRGGAAVWRFNHIYITTFISNKKFSASSQTDSTIETIGSIKYDGYHRTVNEINAKDKLTEFIYGMNIQYKFNGNEVGITCVKSIYDHPFNKNSEPYQQYQFKGNTLINAGLNYQYTYRNGLFYGEFAGNDVQQISYTGGVLLALDQRFDIALHYRKYNQNYHAFYANAFAENSDIKNEEGLYTGISFKLNKRITINSYVDVAHSNWLRFQKDAPTKAHDILSEIKYQPNKTTQLYLRYKMEIGSKNNSDEIAAVNTLRGTIKQLWRVHCEFPINENISAKSRFNYCINRQDMGQTFYGSAFHQDFIIKTGNKHLQIHLRNAIFSIDDYSARIYEPESEVLYQYTSVVYQHQGSRNYMMIQYKLNRYVQCWIKYGITQYWNVSTIGSGNEQIDGNTLHDIRLQLQLKI